MSVLASDKPGSRPTCPDRPGRCHNPGSRLRCRQDSGSGRIPLGRVSVMVTGEDLVMMVEEEEGIAAVISTRLRAIPLVTGTEEETSVVEITRVKGLFAVREEKATQARGQAKGASKYSCCFNDRK